MQANLPALTTQSNHQPAKSGGGFLRWETERAEQLAPTVGGGVARVVSSNTWARLRARDPLSRLERQLRRAGACEAYIALAAYVCTFTRTGLPRSDQSRDRRARVLLFLLLEARRHRGRLETRGLGVGAICQAAKRPGHKKPPHENTISAILRELCQAGLLGKRQPPASKVPLWEQGPLKRRYVLGPNGERVWRWERYAFNRYWFPFADFEMPEPEPGYLQAAVVAKLAIAPTEEETFLAELDEIFASAKPREAPAWPAQPPKGGRGPPN